MEKKLYDQLYEIEEKHWWYSSKADIVIHMMKNYSRLGKKSMILDVGCGTGAFLKRISGRYDAYGTDTENLSIKYCRKRGIRKLFKCTLDTFPKKDMRFDMVTMLDVLEHIKDDQRALHKVSHYLKPGGILILTVPAFQSLWTKHDDAHHHYRRYHRKQLADRLKRAGFKIKKISYYNTILFPAFIAERFIGKITKKATPLSIPPAFINAALKSIFTFEKHLLTKMSFPYGVSLIAVAVKEE